MGKLFQLAQVNRDAILALLKAYHATQPSVFGSALREDETERSDLDLLVCMPKDISLFEVGRLERAVSELLMRDVDLVIEDELHPMIRERVLREARAQ